MSVKHSPLGKEDNAVAIHPLGCCMLCVPAGHQAAGTPHLLLGLLDVKNAAVNKAIEKQAAISLAALRAKVSMFPLPSTACMHGFGYLLCFGQKCTYKVDL